jgi:hypothetical protein
MSEHDEFSRRAAFCRTFAATLADPSRKAALLEMAERWQELPERALHREQTPPSPVSTLSNTNGASPPLGS